MITNDEANALLADLTPDALTILLAELEPLVQRAARDSRVLEFEDARSVARIAVIEAARTNRASKGAFVAWAKAVVGHAVALADRTSDLIKVPDAAAARYWRVLRANDGDLIAAYTACEKGEALLSPATFLAIHRARSTRYLEDDLMEYAEQTPDVAPGWFDAETARLLLAELPDREARVLALAVGLDGEDPMNDGEIAERLGMSRATVQRVRSSAIKTAREVLRGWDLP